MRKVDKYVCQKTRQPVSALLAEHMCCIVDICVEHVLLQTENLHHETSFSRVAPMLQSEELLTHNPSDPGSIPVGALESNWSPCFTTCKYCPSVCSLSPILY